jgi:hypothetical protein
MDNQINTDNETEEFCEYCSEAPCKCDEINLEVDTLLDK